MKSSDLGDLIKQNCVALFKDGYYPKDTPFVRVENLSIMWGICDPAHNFSKWNLFLPYALRLIVNESLDFGGLYPVDGLYLFHYCVMRDLKRKISQTVHDSDEQDLYEFYFRKNYGDASCLLTTLGGMSMVFGSVGVIQQAVDHCKASKDNYFALMRSLMRRNVVDLWRVESAHKIHVYDFVNTPKYVKHEW